LAKRPAHKVPNLVDQASEPRVRNLISAGSAQRVSMLHLRRAIGSPSAWPSQPSH